MTRRNRFASHARLAAVGIMAVAALGHIGPDAREAVPEIIDVMKNEQVPLMMRGRAAEALVTIDVENPKVIAALTEMVKKDVPTVGPMAQAALDKLPPKTAAKTKPPAATPTSPGNAKEEPPRKEIK